MASDTGNKGEQAFSTSNASENRQSVTRNPQSDIALYYSTPRARAFLKSFVYAYYGILQVLATQRNMVVHCIIAIPTLLATQLLGFSPIENVIILICVALVLACEIVNTSIENLGNVVSPEYHPFIRRSKDAAAAMVLISAIASAAVGVILFTSQGRLERIIHLDFEWRWRGIDNVMVKLAFLGICWLFIHAWVYRRRTMREEESKSFPVPRSAMSNPQSAIRNPQSPSGGVNQP